MVSLNDCASLLVTILVHKYSKLLLNSGFFVLLKVLVFTGRKTIIRGVRCLEWAWVAGGCLLRWCKSWYFK